jgi:hypothetical protein
MVTVAIRILEGLFALGAVGSAIVIVLTTIDDLKLLFSRDEKAAGAGLERETTAPSREMTAVARG